MRLALERTIEKHGKKLRYGYTTGSCAAAAAKAAALKLLEGEAVTYMTIDTPKGWLLNIEVFHIPSTGNSATCYVLKDGGDDPDATHGMEIYATVILTKASSIEIEGGIGIGRVTKKGLRISVGNAAINPVPLRMIEKELRSVLPKGQGAQVIIFAPEGIEVAKKTFNAKLGILGGISILGTSGIVEPMSEGAFSDALKVELQVKVARGRKTMAYVFGNFGRDYLGDHYNEDLIHKTSNFVQDMMEAAESVGIEEVLYVGHIGKMAKVAGGMGNTHSKYGDNRMRSIADCGKVVGLTEAEQALILGANTSDEAVEILDTLGQRKPVMEEMLKRCKHACEAMSHHKVKVACVIFSTVHGTLGMTEDGKRLMEALKT